VIAPDLIGLFIAPLENVGIPYVITGGVASVIYGDPRFTRDIDLVLDLSPMGAQRLADAFSGEAYYLPSIEVLLDEVARTPAGHFNIIHRDTALRADVYLAGDDPLHAWAFQRRRRIQVGPMQISVAPIEYVILRKLQYHETSGSDRHLRDVAMMLRISGDLVDHAAMDPWLTRLGLSDAWQRAKGFDPT